MADEVTVVCPCVKWHSPKPTRLGRLQVGAETLHLCPATYTAVTDCVKLLTETGGRATAKQKNAFPKFARDVAQRVYDASVVNAVQQVVEAEAAAAAE